MPTIEENLGRAVVALEKIAKHLSHIGRLTGLDAPDPDKGTVAVTEDEKKAAKKAAAAKKKADKKAADEDGDDGDEAEVPNKAKVRTALQNFMATDGKEAAIDLLKEHADGAENLSQLTEEHHQAVLDAIAEASS